MQKYFPKRSRLELKNKFKREERMNRSLIDKALINPSEFDMTQLEKDLGKFYLSYVFNFLISYFMLNKYLFLL